MKKLLSLLVATLMVVGMIATMAIIPVKAATAADGIKEVVMIANVWNRCGYDRYGRPLYNGKYTTYNGGTYNSDTGRFSPSVNFPTYDAIGGLYFPWQLPGSEMWGRTGYAMPNCVVAIADRGRGRINQPVLTTSPASWSVHPYLYTEAYLVVKAQGGESQLFEKRYIVLDELGQVWIDPDGRYNDCRYWDPANFRSSYYRSNNILSGDGSALWNSCFTNPKMLLDPSGDNNTQGPYIVNPNYNSRDEAWPAPSYHERVYYWWNDVDKKDLSKGIDRIWRLGMGDMTDYLRKDAICADGTHTSSGLIGAPDAQTPFAYYPGKPVLWNTLISDPVQSRWTPNDVNIIANDWDMGLPLANFSPSELFIDVNGNGNYDFGEPVFLDTNGNFALDANDSRLVSYTIQWGGKAFNFRGGAAVGPTDEDIQWFIANGYMALNFGAQIKHTSVAGITTFDQIYNDTDNSNDVTMGDWRISNINYRANGFGITCGGFFQGDVFIMLELLETSCSSTYNVHVQSDLWLTMQEDTYQNPETIPSRTAAAFFSPNGDIYSMAQLVNKATALDVDGKTFYVPTTTFYDIKLLFREYVGLQIFLDNGVDNNLAQGGSCFSLSLSDDHVNFESGEQYLGSKDVETALDLDLPLMDLPEVFLYYETSFDMNPGMFPTGPVPDTLRYGCGETIYKDVNRLPLMPWMPLDPDPESANYNPGVVNKGDVRMHDVVITSGDGDPYNGGSGGDIIVTYKAGSIVTVGDLDVNRILVALNPGTAFYDENDGCNKPNGMFDVGELLYFDPAKAGGARAVRMLGWEQDGTSPNGVEEFGDYGGGSDWWLSGAWDRSMPFQPYGGTHGSNWIARRTGSLSWNTYGLWPNYDDNQPQISTPDIYDMYPPYGPGNIGYLGDDINNHNFELNNWFTGSQDISMWPSDYDYIYDPSTRLYSYSPSASVFYYIGQDEQGNSAMGTDWRRYEFDFDYYPEDNSWYNYGDYGMYGIACIYMQDNVGGYALSAWHTPYDYTYYGWGQTDVTRLHVWRLFNAAPNSPQSFGFRLVTFIDAPTNGSMFPYYTPQRIRTNIVNGVWTLNIPTFGSPIQVALAGSTSYGSVGTYSYNWYWSIYYSVRGHWDNFEVYKIESTPQPGDRVRLTNPGHYIGMNKHVLKKNANGEEPIATSAKASGATSFKPFGYFYPCGTKLAAGEIYDVSSKVTMVSMGKCGDPRYMDIEVLPGKVEVNLDIDGKPALAGDGPHLKVEQTSDIKVSVNPPPKPGEKYTVKITDLYQAGIPAKAAYTDYVESRDSNTFTESDPRQVTVPKTSFTSYYLDDTFSDCGSYSGTLCQELTLPFAFPLFNRLAAAGTKIQVSTNGYFIFMDLNNPQGSCNYNASSIPYPSTSGWMRQVPTGYALPYTICPCGADWGLGYDGTQGTTENPNANIFISFPTTTSMKIRWATGPYYVMFTPTTPAYANFSATIDSEGGIRFSYGSFNTYSNACAVGMAGANTNEIHECVIHGSNMLALNWIDDIVHTYTEFPPDPGRPAGGTTDHDYMVGSPQASETSGGTMMTQPSGLGASIGNTYNKIVEITPENPIQHIQLTPYRGSCQPDGSRDPIKIEVFLERGGTSYPVPYDSTLSGERMEIPPASYADLYDQNIYDPFWVDRPWSIEMYDTRYKGNRTPRPIASPAGIPTVACGLANQYDCYGLFNLWVAPEDIDILPVNRACISPLDMRFPNLVLKLQDHDNKFDVNDPANIPMSTSAMQPGNRSKIIVNVNVHGAGINYLCTAYAINPTSGAMYMYIIQVNMDGSYSFWRVTEGAQGTDAMPMVLDPSDTLFSYRRWNGSFYVDDNIASTTTRLPWRDSDSYAMNTFGTGTALDDFDCSLGEGICDECHLGEGFPRLGDVTQNDLMGRFNYRSTDNWNGLPSRIYSFGIPTLVSNWSDTSYGGEIMVAAQPQDASTPLCVRVYTTNQIFDYNSTLAGYSVGDDNPTIHPPYFVYDDSPGIDYCGTTCIKVIPTSDVNFAEFRLIDHALQFSTTDYTSGAAPTSFMDRPTPFIAHWYDPVCYNYKKDMRAYPGGQSHMGRAIGSYRGAGFNAYPAIFKDEFSKLGTEFYPLTDYGIYFNLMSSTDINNAQQWDQYTLNEGAITGASAFLLIRSIEITGPFMTPFRWIRPTGGISTGVNASTAQHRLISEYNYNGIKNVPIRYDTSGYIRADMSNYNKYMITAADYTNIVDPATDFALDRHSALGYTLPTNKLLQNHGDLRYYNGQSYETPIGFNGTSAYVFDGLIPIQPGNISIKVTLADGTQKIFQDCCQTPPTDGIDVHALGIKLLNEDIEARGGIFVDQKVQFKAIVTENEKITHDSGSDSVTDQSGEWVEENCNNALLYAWQDRGTYDPGQKIWIGAGDGWCTGAPKSSNVYKQGTQFLVTDDKNADEKIAFESGETEIIGSYDMPTNTWTGSYIDARTFQRNNGEYVFDVETDTVGFDFGAMNPRGTPMPGGIKDHVIGWDETLPVWIVAYKYGDDNQDRSFRPLYDSITTNTPSMSHEVYLAGTRKFDVLPNVDLQMTYGPEPLTAGMIPELQNPGNPLSFTFTDANGNLIDFTQGIVDAFGRRDVIPQDVWMHCFIDPHPDNTLYYGIKARLPQYYWLRTDLHNFDGSVVNNVNLYSTPSKPFTPINFTLKRDKDNKAVGYDFWGFCANDAGDFEVYAYTPDRKHSGKVVVKVAQPRVEFMIRNSESGESFASGKGGGDPDFVMTASDNRQYQVTVTAYDAQGGKIKGIAQEVSVCSGQGSDTARFTPFVTRPLSWSYIYNVNSGMPGSGMYGVGYHPVTRRLVYYMVNDNSRFQPWMGIDINNDGKIDPIYTKNDEIHKFQSMHAFYNSYIDTHDTLYQGTYGFVSSYCNFNTTNVRYDDYTYESFPSWDLPPTNNKGYGAGSIYNNPYKGGYVFPDLDSSGFLSFADSLSFNQNGETSFYFWSDDVLELGGLVGNNDYANSKDWGDLYGCGWRYSSVDENYTYTRFKHYASGTQNWYGTNDGSFRLDWDSIPDKVAASVSPKFTLINPENGEEMVKDLLNPDSYDVTYAKRNHFIVRVYPADSRDVKIGEGSFAQLRNDRVWFPWYIGSEHERFVYGSLLNSEVDPAAVETELFFTPTGTGSDICALVYGRYYDWNKRANNVESLYWPPFFIPGVTLLDSCKGLDVTISPLNKILRLGQPDTVIVTVTETGSGYRYKDATVTLKSDDGVINMEAKTNEAGEATFTNVKPESLSKVVAKATYPGRAVGYGEAYIDVDLTPPSIDISAYNSITNKTTITLDGTVTKNSKLKVGNVNADVAVDGKWKATITLVDGENLITLIATGPNGVLRTQVVRIVLDKVPPAILLPEQDAIISNLATDQNVTKLMLNGRVDPGSKVKVEYSIAGKATTVDAEVVNDYWKVPQDGIEVTPGQDLIINVTATDEAGNVSTKNASYKIPKTTLIDLTIASKTIIVDGLLKPLLTQPPYIEKTCNNPMLPLVELQNYLGLNVSTILSSGSITINLNSKTSTCNTGSVTGIIDGNPVTLKCAPAVVGGQVFVPSTFIEEVFKNAGLKFEVTYVGTKIFIKIIW